MACACLCSAVRWPPHSATRAPALTSEQLREANRQDDSLLQRLLGRRQARHVVPRHVRPLAQNRRAEAGPQLLVLRIAIVLLLACAGTRALGAVGADGRLALVAAVGLGQVLLELLCPCDVLLKLAADQEAQLLVLLICTDRVRAQLTKVS